MGILIGGVGLKAGLLRVAGVREAGFGQIEIVEEFACLPFEPWGGGDLSCEIQY